MAARDTRLTIIDEADRLFYERGFEATSFADIAVGVKISRGNFYYHFKTKDEILDAVIARRLEKTGAMLQVWEAESTPLRRIGRFIDLLIANQAKIMAHGCPVGTLCSELAKLDHAAQPAANGLFTLFRDWLAHQLSALGHRADAEALALHLLMRSQGIAVLASAMGDAVFLTREVEAMHAWLSMLDGPSQARSTPEG